MSVFVICDKGAHDMILEVNGATLRLGLPTAYALVNHLGFTLRELARDQVVKGRENLIRGAYCE